MPTPTIVTDALCPGCGSNLHTTQEVVDDRINSIEAIDTTEDENARRGVTDVIQVWCLDKTCPKPPRARVEQRAMLVSIVTVVPEKDLPK